LGLVLLAHAWLLDLWRDVVHRPFQPGTPSMSRGLSVRQIAAPPARPPEAPIPSRTTTPTAAPPGAAPRLRPPSAPATVAASPPAKPAATVVEEAAATAGADHMPGQDPPVYATHLPPPVRLQYALRRGGVTGTAHLDWTREDGRYRLSLQGHLSATPQAAWISQGLLDAAGVAPERYTESRRGREARAANFQREAGRISFSGPSHEYPLVAGAQDRLSWMIQLGAVLAANPELGQPGAQIQVFVVGTRGDGETWVFTVQGRETLDLPSGRVSDAVHLQRQPRRPYDTQADIWLDPVQHHLPVRLHLRVRATGEGSVLELQDVQRAGP
jgi:hypothetical protein